MSKLWITTAAVALLMATGAQAQKTPSAPTGRFTCWTDDKGVRACGDHVPPQYAKQERQVLDAQGRVIDTKEREKTPAELQAEANAKKLAEEMELRKRKQAEYDRFLIETYASERDLQKTRDERIAALDGRLRLTNQAIADNETTLKQLRDRAERNKDKPDPKLAKQIGDFEKSLADNKQAAHQLEQDREAMRKKFEDDIARWRELKSATSGG